MSNNVAFRLTFIFLLEYNLPFTLRFLVVRGSAIRVDTDGVFFEFTISYNTNLNNNFNKLTSVGYDSL